MGTTFTGRPSIFTVFGGSFNFTNRVSRTSWPSGPFVVCQLTTVPSAPLAIQHSVALLCFNITGRPTHNINLPATCLLDDAGGCSHRIFCRCGDITLVFWTGSSTVFFGRPHAASYYQDSSTCQWNKK